MFQTIRNRALPGKCKVAGLPPRGTGRSELSSQRENALAPTGRPGPSDQHWTRTGITGRDSASGRCGRARIKHRQASWVRGTRTFLALCHSAMAHGLATSASFAELPNRGEVGWWGTRNRARDCYLLPDFLLPPSYELPGISRSLVGAAS